MTRPRTRVIASELTQKAPLAAALFELVDVAARLDRSTRPARATGSTATYTMGKSK